MDLVQVSRTPQASAMSCCASSGVVAPGFPPTSSTLHGRQLHTSLSREQFARHEGRRLGASWTRNGRQGSLRWQHCRGLGFRCIQGGEVRGMRGGMRGGKHANLSLTPHRLQSTQPNEMARLAAATAEAATSHGAMLLQRLSSSLGTTAVGSALQQAAWGVLLPVLLLLSGMTPAPSHAFQEMLTSNSVERQQLLLQAGGEERGSVGGGETLKAGQGEGAVETVSLISELGGQEQAQGLPAGLEISGSNNGLEVEGRVYYSISDAAPDAMADAKSAAVSSSSSSAPPSTEQPAPPQTSAAAATLCDGANDAAPQAFAGPKSVSDEFVVFEAWDVVNETFLDARNKGWSEERWRAKREEISRKPIKSRQEAYATIGSMLASLNDPYSRFLTPAQFAQLAKYDITGIGLNLGEAPAGTVGQMKVVVLGIVLGSPAQVAGVQQGDEIVSVDHVPVSGLSAFDVSSLIQGPKDSPVAVGVRHPACEEVKELTMVRSSEVKTPVYYRLEQPHLPRNAAGMEDPDAVGYIRLREFNAVAKRDLAIAIARLRDSGASSFVLDLQDNPGGLVQAGVEIAKLFLPEGSTVVSMEGRQNGTRSVVASLPAAVEEPLTVLVNGRTASASEIVAAALHDNCRAVLVGGRTFGKGLIQSVYELSDGSGMILTVGRYVTPSDIEIDGNGIQPDFRRRPSLDVVEKRLSECKVALS